MIRKQRETLCHFRLDQKLATKLDKVIGRRGYPSRCSYFTAVARITVDDSKETAKTNDDRFPRHVKEWIDENKPVLSEKQIQQHINDTIKSLLYPIIALKGADVAYETAWKELRTAFREEHGIWLTQSEIREAIEEFECLNQAELTDYRNKSLDGEEK